MWQACKAVFGALLGMFLFGCFLTALLFGLIAWDAFKERLKEDPYYGTPVRTPGHQHP